jgi:hypothetical protein
MIWLLHHPSTPLQSISLPARQRKTDIDRKLADGKRGEGRRKIIRRREILVFFK